MAKTEEKLTTAAKVRRGFKAGRPPKADQFLDGLTALTVATHQLKELREQMTKATLEANHAKAWLVLTHPTTGPERVFIAPAVVEKRIALLMSPDTEPRGVVFGQYDADAGKAFFWSKHFRTDPESLKIVEAARGAGELDESQKSTWN